MGGANSSSIPRSARFSTYDFFPPECISTCTYEVLLYASKNLEEIIPAKVQNIKKHKVTMQCFMDVMIKELDDIQEETDLYVGVE